MFLVILLTGVGYKGRMVYEIPTREKIRPPLVSGVFLWKADISSNTVQKNAPK